MLSDQTPRFINIILTLSDINNTGQTINSIHYLHNLLKYFLYISRQKKNIRQHELNSNSHDKRPTKLRSSHEINKIVVQGVKKLFACAHPEHHHMVAKAQMLGGFDFDRKSWGEV